MLPESDRGRLFLLLNEVSYLYDSRENNPYTFTYPHTWKKASDLSMVLWDFTEVVEMVSLKFKKKAQNSNKNPNQM